MRPGRPCQCYRKGRPRPHHNQTYTLHALLTAFMVLSLLQAIHAIADRHKLGVVGDMVGHGVGWYFHSAPVVAAVRNSIREPMRVNQTFTIEPIFVDGGARYTTWKDNWTMVTTDGSWAAQHEHTILITNNGHEILTQF